MQVLSAIAVSLVALLHIGFLVLEMFLWDKPVGLKIFRNSPETAAASKVLAANQGLYNGFLAAGLIYSMYLGVKAARCNCLSWSASSSPVSTAPSPPAGASCLCKPCRRRLRWRWLQQHNRKRHTGLIFIFICVCTPRFKSQNYRSVKAR